MTIKINVGNTTVLNFDIESQDIVIPRGKLSATPSQNTQSLCASVQCYNCTQVNCSTVRCNQVKCNEVKCSNCTVVKCECDCNSDS